MKKAFAVASLAVWTLGLLIGIGFAVAGTVNATNRLPAENHALLQEVASLKFGQQKLLETLAAERTQRNGLALRLSMGHRLILSMVQTNYPISSGPWPHEE